MSALITQYSSANRQVEAALTVFYFKRVVNGKWEGKSYVGGVVTNTYSLMDEYHRVARKAYKYVGMTEAAAKTCAEAMKTIYTRTVRLQYWDETATDLSKQGSWITGSSTNEEMSAEIVVRHVGGAMWETVVNVNEDSVMMSRTDIPELYSTLFSAERLRSYDGETETT